MRDCRCGAGRRFGGGPAAATETKIVPETEPSTPAPECEDCPEDGEGPPPADPEFVEQLPSDKALALVPETRPGSTHGWTRTVGRGTDGHYCGSFYIKHVSYTFNFDGTEYTRIHVEPTSRYAYGFAGGWPFDNWAWDALANCISTGGPHGINVRSWDTIEDQFICHAHGSPLPGRSWDLEGDREATNNPLTWYFNLCNW